jgi:putative serine protease PepD
MTASTVTPQTAARFGVTPGLYVETVTPGGPAAKAGLKSGDIVTKLNGQPALATAQLTNITVHASVGDTVDVEYLRDGTSHTTTVTMEAIAPSEG